MIDCSPGAMPLAALLILFNIVGAMGLVANSIFSILGFYGMA